MTRILVFYPSNLRTVQLETTILAMHRRGVEVELLTTCERGPLHEFLDGERVATHAHPLSQRSSLLYYARQILHLVRFSRERGFTAIYSNLQHANFIAVFAQYLISARVVVFRHHFKFILPVDDIPLRPNRMEQRFDRVINRLARTTVVPSSGVYEGMRAVERADMSRVVVLPYIYDFDRYARPDAEAVAAIRSRFPARLTLLMSGRLIPFKRHAVVFPVVRDLVREGMDLRMLVLGDGPERRALEEFIVAHRLEDRIVMLGFRPDVIDYMAASDLLIHPSLTEASSSVVKEMALVGKTAMVCEGVGDFGEYMQHERNGFVVPRATDGLEIEAILRQVYASPEDLGRLGTSLRASVLGRFSLSAESVNRYLGLAGVPAQGGKRPARLPYQ